MSYIGSSSAVVRRQLLERITEHASQLQADVDELRRFRGEVNPSVQTGRGLITRVHILSSPSGGETTLDGLEILYTDLIDYDTDTLARARFGRLFFDRMAHGLEQVLAIVPRTARTYKNIKHASAIIDVLARAASDHTRSQMQLSLEDHARAEAGGLDGYVAYAATMTDPGKVERYFVINRIYENVSSNRG